MLVSGCARVVIDKIAGDDTVDEHGKFAGGGGMALALLARAARRR